METSSELKQSCFSQTRLKEDDNGMGPWIDGTSQYLVLGKGLSDGWNEQCQERSIILRHNDTMKSPKYSYSLRLSFVSWSTHLKTISAEFIFSKERAKGLSGLRLGGFEFVSRPTQARWRHPEQKTHPLFALVLVRSLWYTKPKRH